MIRRETWLTTWNICYMPFWISRRAILLKGAVQNVFLCLRPSIKRKTRTMKFLLWYADSCMCTVQPHLLVYSLIAVATYRWGLVGGVGRYCCCQPAHPPNPHPPPPRGPQLHLGVDSTFCALLLGNILICLFLSWELLFALALVRQLCWIKILNISNWPMGWQRQLDIINWS